MNKFYRVQELYLVRVWTEIRAENKEHVLSEFRNRELDRPDFEDLLDVVRWNTKWETLEEVP